MKRGSLIPGILIAGALSLAAPAMYHLFNVFLYRSFALKVTLSVLIFAYLVYLLRGDSTRIGKLILGVFSLAVLAIAMLAGTSLASFAVIAIGVIWVARTLLTYSSPIMALADGGLCLLGLGAAVWALCVTQSYWWAIWCFFLVQSLAALIPESTHATASSNSPERPKPASAFADASRAAEAALRQLAGKSWTTGPT
jgi:hypothetical protein